MGTVEIKTMEFVDDIADPNNGYFEALKSNQTISSIQKRKRLTVSTDTTGSSNEIISICKESILENTQISDMILLYHTVFVPRLIYNCESWSNLSSENYALLQKSQLTFLRRVMELPRSVPADALSGNGYLAYYCIKTHY